MLKSNLSVCILALNEAKNLENCLKSVKDLAEEMIVGIDDKTTDKSEEVARKYTDKVTVLAHREIFHENKQKTVNLATKEWILWLDADETVSEALVKEIRKTITKNKNYSAYQLARKNIIFNKWIQHAGWYSDWQIRLWKKGTVSWPCKSVHEHPTVKGDLGKLEEALTHYNYISVSQYLDKLNRYTSLDANRRRTEFKPPWLIPLLTRPVDEFIKRFLVLKGFKDGLHGLALSLLQAVYEMVVVLKVWEKTKFAEDENVGIKAIEKPLKQVFKSWKWWKKELKIDETRNRLKKTWYKGLRKFGF